MHEKIALILALESCWPGAWSSHSAPLSAQGYLTRPRGDLYAHGGAEYAVVYYNGDWFLNGILYYFFGPRYGWAPYYAYAPTYSQTSRLVCPAVADVIRAIHITGKFSANSIPIGAATGKVTAMTRKFFNNTIKPGWWMAARIRGHPTAPTQPRDSNQDQVRQVRRPRTETTGQVWLRRRDRTNRPLAWLHPQDRNLLRAPPAPGLLLPLLPNLKKASRVNDSRPAGGVRPN